MSRFPTLQQTLLERARTSSCSVHFIAGETESHSLPYPKLLTGALSLLGLLQRRGAQPGDELVLLTEHPGAFLDTFWACILGKIVAVPIAQGSADEHRFKFFRVLGKLQRPFVVTDRKSFERLEAFAQMHGLLEALVRIRERCLLLEEISDSGENGIIHPAQPDDLAFIQFSSGSTSMPKGVMLTHRNLMTNIEGITAGMGGLERDACLSWMPLTHDMGLIGFHLTPLVNDVDQWLMPTTLFVRRPLLWMMKANEHRASVTCSPNFGYKHFLKTLTPEKIAGLDLSCIRLIFNGAEPISVALCEDFLAALAPAGLADTAIFPVYGLAEASLAVSFPPPGRPLSTIVLSRRSLGLGNTLQPLTDADAPHAMRFVKLGGSIPGCELRVADTTGRAIPANQVGHLLIRGNNVTGGYYRDPELTAQAVNAEGWLNTGDLGAIVDGELLVTGRYKEIIFVAGQNYYPQDIEEILARQADIELGKAAVAGVRTADDAETDDVIAFVVHKGSDEDFIAVTQRLRRVVNEHAGLAVHAVVPVPQLPKTTSGKIQRFALARNYVDGEYEAVLARLATLEERAALHSSESLDDIENKLLTLCRTHLPDKDLTADSNFFELGVGSLTLAQIFEEVDSAYPGALEVETLFENPSIRNMAAAIRQQKARASAMS